MEQYIIKGGSPLVGEVEIGGAKNAALAILAAAIMTDETVTIDNLPDVNDINVLKRITSGVKLIQLDEGVKVAQTALVQREIPDVAYEDDMIEESEEEEE